MIQIDHMGLDARDPRAAAASLAEILGVGAPTTDGADDDMFRVDVDHRAFLLFSQAADVHPQHVAFRVDPERFAAIVARLRQRQVAFGNDPMDARNGLTDDPLGGAGRVYFVDADRHLFEVTC